MATPYREHPLSDLADDRRAFLYRGAALGAGVVAIEPVLDYAVTLVEYATLTARGTPASLPLRITLVILEQILVLGCAYFVLSFAEARAERHPPRRAWLAILALAVAGIAASHWSFELGVTIAYRIPEARMAQWIGEQVTTSRVATFARVVTTVLVVAFAATKWRLWTSREPARCPHCAAIIE